MKRKERGITLIALVVTIIVLLILAGVSIQMLAGQSGILTQAKSAREETKKGQIRDDVRREIMERMIDNLGDISRADLYEILDKYFELEHSGEEKNINVKAPDAYTEGEENPWEEEDFPESFPKLHSKEGNYTFELGDIYSGDLSGTEKTPTTPIPTTPTAGDMGGENLKKFQGSYVDIGLDINDTNGTEDDWRIFYAGEGRIYLIAADYVPVEKLESWKIIGEGTTLATQASGLKAYKTDGTYPYSVNWSTDPSWMNLPTTPNNFMELVKHTQFTLKEGNQNAGAVSQLLNTTAWNGIVTNAEKKDKMEFCIGGPTLEMWCAAWNANMPESGEADGDGFKKIEAGGTNATGYYVSSEDMADRTFLYMNGTTDELSNLSTLGEKYSTFFTHTSVVSNCYGYWLASPSAGGSSGLLLVCYYGCATTPITMSALACVP